MLQKIRFFFVKKSENFFRKKQIVNFIKNWLKKFVYVLLFNNYKNH